MLVIDKHKYETNKYYFNSAVTLPYATNSNLTISTVAIRILKELHKGNEHFKFKKAGVIVTELVAENNLQINLFENENPKHLALMKTIDNLNQKMGNKKVKIANQNLDLTWDMNQKHLSPKYTTDFSQLLEIKCL